MDKINRPARLASLTSRRGFDEVLAPGKYLERGTIVLQANQTALAKNPRRDVPYPDWKIRYVSNPLEHGKKHPSCWREDQAGFIFSDPELHIDGSGTQWSGYSFYTKEVHEMENLGMILPGDNGCVAEFHVSVKTGTLIIGFQEAKADSVPNTNDGRLYSSELMYQAWRDTCTMHLVHNPGILVLKS